MHNAAWWGESLYSRRFAKAIVYQIAFNPKYNGIEHNNNASSAYSLADHLDQDVSSLFSKYLEKGKTRANRV
ncbi:MAG: hypothetical protein ACE5E7_17145 [Anaerolineae bacterium]